MRLHAALAVLALLVPATAPAQNFQIMERTHGPIINMIATLRCSMDTAEFSNTMVVWNTSSTTLPAGRTIRWTISRPGPDWTGTAALPKTLAPGKGASFQVPHTVKWNTRCRAGVI